MVVHKTAAFGSTDADPGPRFCYEVRNKIWMLTDRAPLGPAERAMYAGSTLRRWARTFARSPRRRALAAAAARGLAAAVRARPRPPEQVLAAAGFTLPAPDPAAPGPAAPGQAEPDPAAPGPPVPRSGARGGG